MKFISVMTTAALLSAPAFAGSYEQKCTVTSVPYTVEVKSKGGNAGEIVGGAVIGGVLGKAVTGEDGGAAVGAIIGGAIANENSTKTHTETRYRDVENCETVYVPAKINDAIALSDAIEDLNGGIRLSREMVMDVQYTIGAYVDGQWGPRSRAKAEPYIIRNAYTPPPVQAEPYKIPYYSLWVNGVVISETTDIDEIDALKDSMDRAGVDSQIVVELR